MTNFSITRTVGSSRVARNSSEGSRVIGFLRVFIGVSVGLVAVMSAVAGVSTL